MLFGAELMTIVTQIYTIKEKNEMFRYKVIFNHSGHLNRHGEGLVSIEVSDNGKRIYFSTGIHITPSQWDGRSHEIVNHPLSDEYREYILNMRYDIERIELGLRNRRMETTLSRVRQDYKYNVKPTASIREFTFSVMENSTRSQRTKDAYTTMITAIEDFSKDTKICDINHDWIERWKAYMRANNLSENTVKGRLKQLHCITQEAIKRDMITQDPFKWITIGNMTPKKEFLTTQEIKRIERMSLKGKEAKIRDMFLLSVYTGLRWSDLTTLEEATIENGILRKRMCKTKLDVFIPIATLFWGKGIEIINRYQPITKLSHCVKCNSTANRIIKDIAARAGIKKRVHFHLARKTCSTLLYQMGLSMQDISVILGHSKMETTSKFYVFGKESSVEKNLRKVFK